MSVKNPNMPSRNRLAARACRIRHQRQKKAAAGKTGITKRDAQLGARPGLLPNSGPNRSITGKQRRKLERKMGHALKRKMEAEGEVVMKDVPTAGGSKEGSSKKEEEKMELDIS